MPFLFQIIQGPSNVWKVHYWGKKSWETNLMCTKKVCVKKMIMFLLRKIVGLPVKKIKPLIKPLLKNSFSTNFQGTGP